MDTQEFDSDGDGFLDGFVEEEDCLAACGSNCSAASGGFTCDDPAVPSEAEQIAELEALYALEESPVAPGIFPIRADCIEVCGAPNNCSGNEETGFQCSPPEWLGEEP